MIKTPLSTMIGGAFWTPGATILGSTSATLDTIIKSLFANSEQGFAYDPNDLSTLYQDAAGTIPVTAAGQPVGLMLDKSKGLSLSSSINSVTNIESVPIGGAAFNSYPIGGSSVAGKAYLFEFAVTDYSGTGNVTVSGGGSQWLVNPSALPSAPASNVTYKVILFALVSAPLLFFTRSTNQCKFSNISVKELAGNHAYQSVSASRPILQRNATTGAYYLAFDGTDDSLQTNSIDFTSTDKVSLFAGVRRLNDEVAAIAELSAGMPANTGTFGIYSNWTVTTDNALVFSSRGNYRISPMVNGVQRNVSYVLVGKSNLRGNFTQVKVGNSTQTLNTDLGGGNYGNYPLYIGRRAGTSLPFNGHLYNLIGIGRLTTDSETIALEKLIAKNTGVTLS